MENMPSSKIKKLAYVLSIVALLSALCSYFKTTLMGFPDGYLTDFERAIKPWLLIYGLFALIFGVLLYSLTRFSNQARIRLIYYFSFALFSLISIGVLILQIYFKSHLDHGGGG